MSYDEFAFQEPALSATAELSIPEATFHLKLSRDAWAACSLLTTRASMANTETVQLLHEISPRHDFAVAVGDTYSVPMGYQEVKRVVAPLREFLSRDDREERWRSLVLFEPLGFVIYGRWATDERELLVQDARDSPPVNAVFTFPASRVPDWLSTLDRLAATLSITPP
ncbi:MAG TPA: hypothetical protein VLK84_08865 [Longimicrobium sp.]|nr:hypothetical protein [Longimicrobium sp.]